MIKFYRPLQVYVEDKMFKLHSEQGVVLDNTPRTGLKLVGQVKSGVLLSFNDQPEVEFTLTHTRFADLLMGHDMPLSQVQVVAVFDTMQKQVRLVNTNTFKGEILTSAALDAVKYAAICLKPADFRVGRWYKRVGNAAPMRCIQANDKEVHLWAAEGAEYDIISSATPEVLLSAQWQMVDNVRHHEAVFDPNLALLKELSDYHTLYSFALKGRGTYLTQTPDHPLFQEHAIQSLDPQVRNAWALYRYPASSLICGPFASQFSLNAFSKDVAKVEIKWEMTLKHEVESDTPGRVALVRSCRVRLTCTYDPEQGLTAMFGEIDPMGAEEVQHFSLRIEGRVFSEACTILWAQLLAQVATLENIQPEQLYMETELQDVPVSWVAAPERIQAPVFRSTIDSEPFYVLPVLYCD